MLPFSCDLSQDILKIMLHVPIDSSTHKLVF